MREARQAREGREGEASGEGKQLQGLTIRGRLRRRDVICKSSMEGRIGRSGT